MWLYDCSNNSQFCNSTDGKSSAVCCTARIHGFSAAMRCEPHDLWAALCALGSELAGIHGMAQDNLYVPQQISYSSSSTQMILIFYSQHGCGHCTGFYSGCCFCQQCRFHVACCLGTLNSSRMEFRAVSGLLVSMPFSFAVANCWCCPQLCTIFRPLTISSAVGSRPFGRGHTTLNLCTLLFKLIFLHLLVHVDFGFTTTGCVPSWYTY